MVFSTNEIRFSPLWFRSVKFGVWEKLFLLFRLNQRIHILENSGTEQMYFVNIVTIKFILRVENIPATNYNSNQDLIVISIGSGISLHVDNNKDRLWESELQNILKGLYVSHTGRWHYYSIHHQFLKTSEYCKNVQKSTFVVSIISFVHIRDNYLKAICNGNYCIIPPILGKLLYDGQYSFGKFPEG